MQSTMPVHFCNVQIILFSHLHWQISKECCASDIKTQSMQVWKKKNIQIMRFIISPCWSMQKKSCPLTNMQMLKATHGLGCWVYRAEQSPSAGGYQDRADPLPPPSLLHREPSDFNQKPLSTLTPTSSSHRHRYGQIYCGAGQSF